MAKKTWVLTAALLVTLVATIGAGPSREAAATQPVELTWYFIGNGPQGDVALVEAEVNKYIQQKGLNATVKLVCFDWGSYDNRMQTIIASGEAFDICFTAVWTNNYRNNALRGAFAPLNDLLTQYAPKTKELLGADFLAGSAIDGVNYAIPANKEKAHNWGFILRQDLVTKYAMDISKIRTFADIEPFLQTIKQGEPGMYPLEACNGENPAMALDWDKMVDDNVPVSLYPDNRSNKVVFELETPENKALYETMHRFYQAGYVRSDAATVTDFNADEKAGLIFAAVKSLKPGKDAEMTNQTGQPWTQVDITPAVMSNRETTGSLQAISRSSKNPEMAMRFLELFNTDKYLNNLINFGIEGTHYTKVSAEIIRPAAANDRYNPGTGWMFGNQFLNYLLPNEDPAKWTKFVAYNGSATPLRSLGFSFAPTQDLQTEIAACRSVWSEYNPVLATGTVDPARELANAVAKFKAAGIEKIMADVQTQYDAWLSKN